MKTDEHAVVAGCATGRPPGCPVTAASTSCAGRPGNCGLPATPTSKASRSSARWPASALPASDVLDAWAVHAEDLHVLVLASRGPTDPVAVRLDELGPSSGWTGYGGRGTAMRRRRAAVTAVHERRRGGARNQEDTLATLLSLGGPLQARLTATVAAAWRERLRDGAAAADAAAADEARPALHAALYGRVVATLRAWTGRPDLRVALTMIREAARPALARDGDGLAAELPFGWISEVWARGLGTCWDRFCLAAAPAGDGWALSAVAPDLGPPTRSRSPAPHPARHRHYPAHRPQRPQESAPPGHPSVIYGQKGA